MDPITELFERMDEWRHLPSYQLERRADVFFSLYLPEVLEKELGFPMREHLIPEFPVAKGVLDSASGPDNRTFKIDYLARSRDGESLVFVELKTDNASIRREQEHYLDEARDKGLPELLDALRAVITKTRARGKYGCLLAQLERLELVTNVRPGGSFDVTAPNTKPIVVYVQPRSAKVRTGTKPIADKTVLFATFAEIVGEHNDPVSQRFAQSLREWACVDAGKPLETGAAT